MIGQQMIAEIRPQAQQVPGSIPVNTDMPGHLQHRSRIMLRWLAHPLTTVGTLLLSRLRFLA